MAASVDFCSFALRLTFVLTAASSEAFGTAKKWRGDWELRQKGRTVAMGMISNAVSGVVAVTGLVATCYLAYISHSSFLLYQRTQQVSLFAQFESEYTAIPSKFPPQMFDRDFRPPRDSVAYKSLEDYWIFAYAEWFATNKFKSDSYKELWDGYYADLIQNALEVPSLRCVLIDMSHSYAAKNKNAQEFYGVLRDMARNAGEPLEAEAPNSPTR